MLLAVAPPWTLPIEVTMLLDTHDQLGRELSPSPIHSATVSTYIADARKSNQTTSYLVDTGPLNSDLTDLQFTWLQFKFLVTLQNGHANSESNK